MYNGHRASGIGHRASGRVLTFSKFILFTFLLASFVAPAWADSVNYQEGSWNSTTKTVDFTEKTAVVSFAERDSFLGAVARQTGEPTSVLTKYDCADPPPSPTGTFTE